MERRLKMMSNKWLQLISYKQGHLHSLARPDVFQIEPTNHCNLRCPMCPHDLMTREVGFMDMELFRYIVNQVKGYSGSMRLHNMGESLFHKKIDQFIAYAKKSDIRTTLSTNATALTKKVGERIIDAGLDNLLISFDGASRETYEYFREGADYDKVIEKIDDFMEHKAASGSKTPRVTMSLINMPVTGQEERAFRQRWERYADEIRIKPPRNWDGSSERINALVDIPDTRQEYAPCYWLWSSLVILWDGRVVPCCMDYDGKAIVGDIRCQNLHEIFNGEPMRRLREMHLHGQVSQSPLCRGCSAPTSAEGRWLDVAAGIGGRFLKTPLKNTLEKA